VDQVVAKGIPYFSSAGNNGRNSWIAPTGFNPVNISNKIYHQFGTNSTGSPITSMRINVQGDSNLRSIVIQWDEPFSPPGSRSDVDFFLRIGGTKFFNVGNNTGNDPLGIFQFAPFTFSSNATVSAELQIQLVSGPPPTYMKIVVFGQVTSFEFPTSSSTLYGHANSALGAGVGAAFYSQTPAFGFSPPLIEFSSAAGGTPILFTKNGTRLLSPEIRNQPLFTGPDGGATTFFGSNSSGIFRFFGTSASASHVAAVAALMLQLKGGNRSLAPMDIYSKLAMTATDMDNPFVGGGFDVGFDFQTGWGLVNASASLDAAILSAPVALPIAPTPVAVPVAPTPIAVPSAPTPVAAPKAPKCGLFGFRIFCPFTFCGIFGRFLGFCRI
jgi:hypothetical protein